MASESTQGLSVPPLPPQTEQTQEAAPPSAALEIITPEEQRTGLEQYPMTEAVKAAADVGAFRTPGAKVLLQAICRLREADLQSAREERQTAQASSDSHRNNYHAEHVKRAVLEERLRCGVPFRRLQNVLITLGGIMFGAGLQPIVAGFSLPYCVLAVVGAVLLFCGWYTPQHSDKEEEKR